MVVSPLADRVGRLVAAILKILHAANVPLLVRARHENLHPGSAGLQLLAFRISGCDSKMLWYA